jgi:hypothetical protein
MYNNTRIIRLKNKRCYFYITVLVSSWVPSFGDENIDKSENVRVILRQHACITMSEQPWVDVQHIGVSRPLRCVNCNWSKSSVPIDHSCTRAFDKFKRNREDAFDGLPAHT